jgi:hypothetical protein
MADPQFGGYGREVVPQRTSQALAFARPEDFGAGVGDAIVQGGRVAGQIAIDNRRLETQREYDRQTTAAMLAYAQLQRDYGVAENEARVNAAPGAAGHTQAMAELAKKQGEQFLSTIGHEGLRQAYAQRLADWQGNRDVAADAFERGSTVKLMLQQLDQTSDIIANQLYGRPLAEYSEAIKDIETMEAPTGVPADALAEWRRGAAQKATVRWLQGQEPEVRKGAIATHGFDMLLSTEQMAFVDNEADSDIRRKQIEADAAARAAKAEAVEKVDDVLDRINRGYPVSDDEYAAAMELAQGNGLDKRVRDLNDAFVGKQVNKEYAGATPAQIDARIKVIDAELQAKGDKAPPTLVAERGALDKLLTERTSQVKNDPLAAGAAMGISVQPIDWSDPKSIVARRQAAEATGKALGVPPKYLSDEEADQLAANAGTPSGQLAIARQLRPLGPVAAKAAAQQVAPGDSLFAYAMGLRPDVQQAIFRGKDLRKEFTVPAKDAQQAWRDITGTAMARMPAASREAAYLSAIEIYRQAASRAGKDEFDLVLFRGAVREALGGTVNGRLGGIGEWNGTKIMLPPNMSQSAFDARLAGFNPQRAHRADKSKIPATEFRSRFTPVMQPNGKYRFVSGRGEYVVIEDGRSPLEVDMSKVKPAAPKAKPEIGRHNAPVYRGPPQPARKPSTGPAPRASGV